MSAKRPQAQYSDREKAEALLGVITNSGNVKKTADESQIPNQTLVNWTKGIGINADVRKMVEENCLNLALELDSLSFQAVGLLPDKLLTASVRDLVGVFSQAIEKSQLLKGKATSIAGSLSDLEGAKLVLEDQRRTNGKFNKDLLEDERLSDWQIYKFVIKRRFPDISAEQLQITEEEGLTGNEEKNPA